MGGPARSRRLLVASVAVLALVTLSACGSSGGSPSAESPGTQPSVRTTRSASVTPSVTASPTAPSVTASPTPTPTRPRNSGRPVLGGAPPPWLGTRVLPLTDGGFGTVEPTPPELVQRRFTLPDTLPGLPGAGFEARVTSPAPASVIARSTWKPGCPVAARDLAWVRLTFWGFDDARHTGELLVNSSAAQDMVTVFGKLYAARFPIEEMRISRVAEQDVPPTGDGNDTGAFDCRVTRGATTYSQHAYGLAVDVNPFQNPYRKGDVVLPELASSYLDRGFVRPGMILTDNPVVRAFASVGWTWGGTWRSLKDLQHFSENGR